MSSKTPYLGIDYGFAVGENPGSLTEDQFRLATDRGTLQFFGTNVYGTSGLVYAWLGGNAIVGGNPARVAGGSAALAPSSTHYIERTAAGVVTHNTTGWTGGLIPLAKVVTGATAITSIEDWRMAGTGTGGSATWGGISGTLSDQTDLNTALNGKAPTVHAHAIADVTGLQTALDGKQAGSSILSALTALAATGLIVATSATTLAARTLTGTANQITVANGNGVAGNPTLSLPQDIHTAATPTFASLTLSGAALTLTGVSANRVPFFNGSATLATNSNFNYVAGTGLQISDTTASTSSTTGAHVVSGGVGVGGAITAAGSVTGMGVFCEASNPAGSTSGNLYIKQYLSGVLYQASIGGTTNGGIILNPNANNPTLTAYNPTTAAVGNRIGIYNRLLNTGAWFDAGGVLSYCTATASLSGSADLLFYAVHNGNGGLDPSTALRMVVSSNGYVIIGRKGAANVNGTNIPHKFVLYSDDTDIGTVATNGTTTLTGTGTRFLRLFRVGDTITVQGETVRTIATIASDTSLTVTVAFSTTASALTWTKVLRKAFYVEDNGNCGIDGDLIFNTGTGTKIGTSTTQKLAFWNATPIVRPTAITAATALTSAFGTGGTALSDVGAAFSQTTLNNNFKSVVDKTTNLETRVNDLYTRLQNMGLVA